MSGKILYKKKYKYNTVVPGYHQRTIDLKALGISPGHYIVSMETTYDKHSSRFIYREN